MPDSSSPKKPKAAKKSKQQEPEVPIQGTRETVESVIVAFVLAFLFRAFVAEAFVIPTGSMAPTLMGAHKDVFCEQCGQQFQNGVSEEFDTETGLRTNQVFIAGCCSNCRALNKYDFRGNSDHVTFSGDRILVSKFDYVLSKPERWDVFVFKFPQSARMNYIKRLVGLPGESLMIREGDIFIKQPGQQSWEIARKPPRKIRAMRRVVSDTSNPAPALVKAGWPANWQPQGNGASNWETINDPESGWRAKLSASSELSQVRYFHKVPTIIDWEIIAAGQQINVPGSMDSQLVTDYLAYNTVMSTNNRELIYDGNSLRPTVTTENRAFDIVAEQGAFTATSSDTNRGLHWVGDLMFEANLDISGESGQLRMDIVEMGVRYQLIVDVSNGQAKLSGRTLEGEAVQFGGGAELTAETDIQGSGSHTVALSNFDDELLVWIDGAVVNFGDSTYDSAEIRVGNARRPYWTQEDPMDAAPLGIAGQGIELEISDVKVYRDIYYIADIPNSRTVTDIPLNAETIAAVPVRDIRLAPIEAVQAIYGMPQWWEQTNLFALRQTMEFQLDERQYLPLGDNSSRSSDGRAWTGRNYVGQEYLLGKALLVFWPHTWNTPIPFSPNIHRMGLIR